MINMGKKTILSEQRYQVQNAYRAKNQIFPVRGPNLAASAVINPNNKDMAQSRNVHDRTVDTK